MVDRLRLNEITAFPSAKPQVVSVMSGKGGVGKSLLAFNLAERVAASGFRVLLIDTDWNGGNLHLLANAAPRFGVIEWLRGGAELGETIYPINSTLDLIASVHQLNDESIDSAEQAIAMVNRIRREATSYDLVIIDHGSGVSSQATVLAHASHRLILVAVPELTSLSDIFGLFKYVTINNPQLNSTLLLNRIETVEQASEIAGQFDLLCRQLLSQHPGYLGYLSEDSTIRKAVSAQQSVFQFAPNSDSARQLDTLSRTLSESLGLQRSTDWPVPIQLNTKSADIEGTTPLWLQPSKNV